METSWKLLVGLDGILDKKKAESGSRNLDVMRKQFLLRIFHINFGVFLEAKTAILLDTSIKNRIGDTCEFMTKSGPVVTWSWERSSAVQN